MCEKEDPISALIEEARVIASKALIGAYTQDDETSLRGINNKIIALANELGKENEMWKAIAEKLNAIKR